jgi:pimeloyl-ACP methyl ester carboxylesterase
MISHERRMWSSQNLLASTRPGNSKCALFIHGLGGNNHNYWGPVQNFLTNDDRLSSLDVYFWMYRSSHRTVWPRAWRRLSEEERLPTIEAITAALQYLIIGLEQQFHYTDFALFGHSLGGIISLLATETLIKDQTAPISRLCLNATPHRPPLLARILRRCQFGLNPQIASLADRSLYAEKMRGALEYLAAQKVHVDYLSCIGDYIVDIYINLPFSSIGYLQAPHNWMHDLVDIRDRRYLELINFLSARGR